MVEPVRDFMAVFFFASLGESSRTTSGICVLQDLVTCVLYAQKQNLGLVKMFQ